MEVRLVVSLYFLSVSVSLFPPLSVLGIEPGPLYMLTIRAATKLHLWPAVL